MTDLQLRLVVVLVVVAVAAGAALTLRRGRAVFRRPVSLPGHGPGLVLFVSRTCSTCDDARRALGDRAVVEVVFEEHGDAFPTAVRRVPAVAHLDASGSGWIAFGVPTRRRVARWVRASAGDP